MSIVQNVNKSLSWIKVANLLNLKILSAALPSRTTCPLCDNPRLLILADPSTHGQWHYCPDCGSNGSLVELAAKCWKVTTGSALLKLHSEIGPLPKEILSEAGVTEYETKSKTIYEDLKGVWNKAKDSGLLNDPTIQNLSKQ